MITQINTEFRLKDLGILNYFVGMDVHIKDDCLLLSQHKYVVYLFHKTGHSDLCSMSTPMTGNVLTKLNLEKDVCHCPNVDIYRSTIDALQHICVTRPHIAFVVNKLSSLFYFVSLAYSRS